MISTLRENAENRSCNPGLRQHVAGGARRGSALSQDGDQRACLLQIVLFLVG
jgi:hypothetical protein